MNASEVIISKDGRYIYVGNRDVSKPNKNRNTIGVFEIKEMQNTISIGKI
jgi:6-phosphogluconolactonase (cycloisomerase 2 family)